MRVPRGSAGLQLTLRGGPGTQAAVCAWLCLGPAGCHPLPEAPSAGFRGFIYTSLYLTGGSVWWRYFTRSSGRPRE